MHRLQISVFGAVAIVFSVHGVNSGIFSGSASLDAMAAGWLILSIVNILWTLYFTSEEDSLMFSIFNRLGTGGLTPPSRRRRTRPMSVHNIGNGYSAGYAAPPGGIGPSAYDTKSFGGPVRSDANSFKATSVDARSLGGAGSVSNMPAPNTLSTNVGGLDPNAGLASPLMGSGAAGIGAGGGGGAPAMSPATTGPDGSGGENHQYRAKALYNCECLVYLVRSIICLHGNPPSRHRLRGRPQRDLLHKGGDTGDSRQEREVVASEEIRRDSRK